MNEEQELEQYIQQMNTYLQNAPKGFWFSEENKNIKQAKKNKQQAETRLRQIRQQQRQNVTTKQLEQIKGFQIKDGVYIDPEPDPLHYDTTKIKFPWFRIKRIPKWWVYRRINKKYPHRSVVCHIFLRNGNRRELLVMERRGAFIYEDCCFIMDNVSKRFNIDAREYEYIFFEELSIPLDFEYQHKGKTIKYVNFPKNPEINLKEIKAILDKEENVETAQNFNPVSLKNTIDAEVARQVLVAKAQDKFNNFMKFMLIAIAIGVGIIIIMLLQKGGSN